MVPLLVILGFVALLVGMFTLNQATMGVGVVAIGCFLGIMARIVQADSQHAQLQRALKAAEKPPDLAEPVAATKGWATPAGVGAAIHADPHRLLRLLRCGELEHLG